MRLFPIALIAIALHAQEPAQEARIAVSGGELRYLFAPAGAPNAPLLFVLPGGVDDASVQKLFAQWRPLAAARRWNFAMPFVAGVSDQATQAAAAVLADAKKRLPAVDEARVYLVGPGSSAGEVFY